MSSSAIKINPTAVNVSFTRDTIHVILADGREVITPLEWYPRLRDATDNERNNWRFIGDGQGIHWPDIDEDISVAGLLAIE